MTEDGAKCGLISWRDSFGGAGIGGADGYSRNSCWKRPPQAGAIDANNFHTYYPVQAKSYVSTGNGWCLGPNGKRIKFPYMEWKSTAVSTEGSAELCETQCNSNAACVGYMTEGTNKCDVILSSDSNAGAGITGADAE